jgi:dGTPase
MTLNSMDWGSLLTPRRYGWTAQTTQEQETRSTFQRDYDRIIFSSPFRRLQNKTQVFPLPGSVFVHNRLTHSLEVASVGRSLGNNIIPFLKGKVDESQWNLIEQIPTILSTACLAHDLGNPPFGHSGEDAIRMYFVDNEQRYRKLLSEEQWLDLTRFEGNANALRLLTMDMKGKRTGGFRLSYPTLSTIVKYPWESTLEGKKKFGFFQAEKELYTCIANELGLLRTIENPLSFARHPLVYLVEAADDICYQIMDIDDAHKLSILSTSEVIEMFMAFFSSEADLNWKQKIEQTLAEVDDENEKIAFLRAMVIGKLTIACTSSFEKSYNKIMLGESVPALINQVDNPCATALERIRSISIQKVYNHQTVVEIELAGYKILSVLLSKICPAMLNPNDSYSKKVLRLVPQQYIVDEQLPYKRLMSAVDFISGMTDVYALEMYRTLEGISIPGINR